MSVTTGLVSIVLLLGALLAWRLFRWRWRPGLRLGHGVEVDGTDRVLRVRNAGAAEARHCRGRLLRADIRVGHAWRRLDPAPEVFPMTWSGGAAERDLGAGEDDAMVVARGNRLEPGRYRIEVAVIDGEERLLRTEFVVPGADAPGGGDG